MSDEKIHVRAKGLELRHRGANPDALEFAIPEMVPSGSDGFVDWVWKFFQFIFPLDNPRGFQPPDLGGLSDSDRAILARYLSHAEALASATVMPAKNGYEVSQSLRGTWSGSIFAKAPG